MQAHGIEQRWDQMNQTPVSPKRFHQVEDEIRVLGLQPIPQLSQFQSGGQRKNLVAQGPQRLSDGIHLDQHILLIRSTVVHHGIVNHRHTHINSESSPQTMAGRRGQNKIRRYLQKWVLLRLVDVVESFGFKDYWSAGVLEY